MKSTSPRLAASERTWPAPRWASRFHELAAALHAPSDLDARRAKESLWLMLTSLLAHHARLHAARFGGVAPEELEDLVSEKAMNMMSRLQARKLDLRDRAAEQLSAYVSGVARKGLLELFRKKGRNTVEFLEELDDVSSATSTIRVASLAPDAQLQSKEYADAMKQCAAALESRARLMWFFRVFHGMSSKHIAAHPEVGLKPAHVDVILQRARDSMRGCMERSGHDPRHIPTGVLARLWFAFRYSPQHDVA